MADNTLYYGDNLDILRRYIPDGSVDLIYLDPPFNSKADYNVLFAEHDGSRSAAQIKAFEDTWRWASAAPTYYETVEQGGKVSKALQAFRLLLGEADMLAVAPASGAVGILCSRPNSPHRAHPLAPIGLL